jgi:hypothetical protein
MTNNDNISIKLELNKDKTTGKLAITARFNSNAKNVKIENGNYFWMPTIEEKDLINEAFDTFYGKAPPTTTHTPEPKNTESTTTVKSTVDSILNKQKEEEPIKEEPIKEEPIKEELIKEEPIKEEPPETIIENESKVKDSGPESNFNAETQEDIKEDEDKDLPPLEEKETPSVFEITDDDIKKDEPTEKKEPTDEDLSPKVKVNDPDNKDDTKDSKKDDKKEDEDIIVEADDEAIEAAIKKHTADNDDSIVEADEKTIIDKVLSQKKKGKWGKIK